MGSIDGNSTQRVNNMYSSCINPTIEDQPSKKKLNKKQYLVSKRETKTSMGLSSALKNNVIQQKEEPYGDESFNHDTIVQSTPRLGTDLKGLAIET